MLEAEQSWASPHGAILTSVTAISGYPPIGPFTATASTSNQLSCTSGCTTAYDAAGNTTSSGSGLITYDDENRILSTNGVTYTYDGDGKRVEKSTGTLYWTGAGADVLSESNLSGTINEEYVFFNGLRVSKIDRPSNTSHVFLADHLESSRMSLVASGTNTFTVEEDLDYTPYGIVAYGTPSDHYQFSGKEYDSESGLNNFGARYDYAILGRFMTPDWAVKPTTVPYAKFGDPQTLNLYSYVENGPLNRIDPDGHSQFFGPGDQQSACGSNANSCQQQQAQEKATQAAQNSGAQPSGNGSTSIVTVSATSSVPGTFLGGVIGELIDPIGGGIPGAILGSMVGVGANVSYVPSTDSTYAGPTVSFTPAPFGGNGVSVSDAIVPAGQNANSIANGTTYSVQFQPTPLTGSTVTKSPGSGPVVAGPSVGTKVPLSFSASHNFDITPAVRSVTNFVNRTINTVESWF